MLKLNMLLSCLACLCDCELFCFSFPDRIPEDLQHVVCNFKGCKNCALLMYEKNYLTVIVPYGTFYFINESNHSFQKLKKARPHPIGAQDGRSFL